MKIGANPVRTTDLTMKIKSDRPEIFTNRIKVFAFLSLSDLDGKLYYTGHLQLKGANVRLHLRTFADIRGDSLTFA